MSEIVCFSAVLAASRSLPSIAVRMLLERVAQARPELTVALAVLQTLTMRFERGCMQAT